ncbi:MAG: PfkB family carbohydrate kinase [Halothermotrichaceae bacterium]
MAVDIITMGEMLIDFVPLKKGLPLKENKGFLRMPGGAPANVAVGAAKLGLNSAFFGKVGNDPFGRLLIETLKDNEVETKAIMQTDKAKTTLAFVTLDEAGDRDFTFYRDPGADMLYKWQEVDVELLKTAKYFHHGSISLINQPARDTTIHMAQFAKDKGILVSYDPNLRMPLWSNEKEAKKWITEGLKTADIVKLSEEELEFITGEKEIDNGVKKIMEYGSGLLFVTLGEKGCYFNNGSESKTVPGFRVEVQDTTGAGDAFVAGILSQLAKHKSNINELSKTDLVSIVRFANAVGALTTKGKGAIASLPELESINNFIKSSTL